MLVLLVDGQKNGVRRESVPAAGPSILMEPRILLAMDISHPEVARASVMLGQATRQLRSITDDHPLVRYGILPSGYCPQPEAAAA